MWISNFAYGIDFNLFAVLISSLALLLLALSTIGYQSIKAALKSPIDNLRDE
jgi:putative ABC transport system permease protein